MLMTHLDAMQMILSDISRPATYSGNTYSKEPGLNFCNDYSGFKTSNTFLYVELSILNSSSKSWFVFLFWLAFTFIIDQFLLSFLTVSP